MSEELTQTEITMRLLKEEWLADERDRLLEEVGMFDPSDDFHIDVTHKSIAESVSYDRGYYHAIDRVDALIRGQIKTWTDPKPEG